MRHLLPLFLLCLLVAAPADADVVSTRSGLKIEGKATQRPDGSWEVQTAKGRIHLPSDRVAGVEPGVTPRADLVSRAAKLSADDVAGQFRLALEAEQAGQSDLACRAYERVLAVDADHRAARRALGYERVGAKWVTQDEARRLQGLVLFGGKWLLPQQVERASSGAAPVPVVKASTLETVIRTLAKGEPALKEAAQIALADKATKHVVPAALRTLYDKDPVVRAASAQLLADLGDEAALRPLIYSAVRDKDADVRREAVRATKAFGHDDTAIPFVRALASANPQVAGHAAQALAGLGDQRVVGYLVKKLRSSGSSARNFVAFLNQISYVRDYDVEIAQASNIANPDVATLMEGVVLDAKVIGATFTKTWLEPIIVDSIGSLVGQDFRTADEALRWYAANAENLPRFPEKPARRAPRRREGRVIGAPVLD